jgi:exosome complex exonuclease DIS3/RRP44
LIDNKEVSDETAMSLRGLMRMAKLLKAKRLDKGALQLASTQVKFQFEEETHNPTDVSFYNLLDTNSMVEEFMLLANIAVAEKTLAHFPGKAILRRHSTPKPLMIKEFSSLLTHLGYNLDYSSSRALAASLDEIDRKDDPFFNKLVRILTTRCMNEAVYICTADFDYPEYFHYGLAAEVYTHFTSPIRRYADVLVHRLLAASLDIDSLPQSMCNKHNLTKICDNMNNRHRNARFASRASSDYYTFMFFKDKELTESALISGIELNGISVLIPKYGFEGFAEFTPEDEAENKKMRETDNQKIVTKCVISGKQYNIFDRITVKVSMKMKHFRKQIYIKLTKDE